MPLSGRGPGEDSLEGLGAVFSGLSVGVPEGKENEKERGSVDMGVEEEDPGDEHHPSDEVPIDDKPAECAPSACDQPAAPSHIQQQVRKSHCHVFLGGRDPGQAPLKTLLLMLRQT